MFKKIVPFIGSAIIEALTRVVRAGLEWLFARLASSHQ